MPPAGLSEEEKKLISGATQRETSASGRVLSALARSQPTGSLREQYIRAEKERWRETQENTVGENVERGLLEGATGPAPTVKPGGEQGTVGGVLGLEVDTQSGAIGKINESAFSTIETQAGQATDDPGRALAAVALIIGAVLLVALFIRDLSKAGAKELVS